MAAPLVLKPIPPQIVNELAAFGPFNLKEYFSDEPGLQFSAQLSDGRALPKGMICTQDGNLTGIPAKDTQGAYEVVITARNAEGSVEEALFLTIKPSNIEKPASTIDELKAGVWQALEQKLPVPDISDIYNRAVSILDVYYLLERWATLIIWNATDLTPPTQPVLLQVEKLNPHYQLFDRGSCLVASPKDLYSHERTLADALQAARSLADEVYKRDWVIEFAGFEKMIRAAWVELQHLENKHGKRIEILQFDPGYKELRIYSEEYKNQLVKRAEQRQ